MVMHSLLLNLTASSRHPLLDRPHLLVQSKVSRTWTITWLYEHADQTSFMDRDTTNLSEHAIIIGEGDSETSLTWHWIAAELLMIWPSYAYINLSATVCFLLRPLLLSWPSKFSVHVLFVVMWASTIIFTLASAAQILAGSNDGQPGLPVEKVYGVNVKSILFEPWLWLLNGMS